MQAFRDLIRGWLGKSLLALLLVPFALVGVESYFSGGKVPPAAKVNGEAIEQHELDRSLDQQKQRIIGGMGENFDASRIDNTVLRQQVLKTLVEQQLLAQHAKDAGFMVSDEMIWKLIAQTPAFMDNGKFSQERFVQVLHNAGEDPITFPQKAKREIAIAQLASGITQTALVGAKEADSISMLDNQKRDVHILTVPATQFLSTVQVSDAEVAQYYKAHPKDYTTEDKVALEYIVLGAENFLSQATFTDSDLEARYAEKVKALEANEQRHAAHILIKVDDKTKDADALAQIKGLEKRVLAGEDFGALAKQYSQDPGSAANNGDLGLASRGMFVPEFEKSLYALKQGEVSAPIKTQFGYHLIKLLDIQKPAVPTLADMKSTLETEVRQNKAEDLYADALDKIDALAYESSDLKDAAQKYGLTVQLSPLVGKAGGEGVLANRKVMQAAFSDDVLRDGKNSQGVHLEDKHTVWVRVKTHEAPKLQPLEQVAAQIRLSLQLDKASALAKAEAEAIVKELTTGKPAAEVATAHKLQWQDFPATGRRGGLPSQDLLKVAFRLSTPTATAWSAEATALGKDQAVVAVSHIEAGASSLGDEERKQLRVMLANARGQQELQDYVNWLRSTAKIEERQEEKKTH